jgi:hypothetical protein
VREFLIRRRVRPDKIDFRVSAPVSVRRGEQRGEMGKPRLGMDRALPIGEAEPAAQLDAHPHDHRGAQALAPGARRRDHDGGRRMDAGVLLSLGRGPPPDPST